MLALERLVGSFFLLSSILELWLLALGLKVIISADAPHYDNFFESHSSRLTSLNLRRKSAVEDQQEGRQSDYLEDQTSGNLESIAESSRWEEESDADSAVPDFRKR